jgi:hypothetical protein
MKIHAEGGAAKTMNEKSKLNVWTVCRERQEEEEGTQSYLRCKPDLASAGSLPNLGHHMVPSPLHF